MKWTVHDGFQKFFEPEKRDVICEQCIHGSTATQTLTVVNRYVVEAIRNRLPDGRLTFYSRDPS
jgi:hypothetical protein